MDILAVIPARGGSKGVPRKNIRTVAGKPLIGYSIEQALASRKVTKVVVTTDDAEIKAVAKKYGRYGVEVIDRPSELANDTAPMLPVLKHAVETVRKSGFFPEVTILLQPTNPMRKTEQIDGAIQMLVDNAYDSVTAVHKLDVNPSCLMKINSQGKTNSYLETAFYGRRQDIEPLYVINGLLYVYKTDALWQLEKGSWCSHNGAFVVDKEFALDIDTEQDLKEANRILENLENKKPEK